MTDNPILPLHEALNLAISALNQVPNHKLIGAYKDTYTLIVALQHASLAEYKTVSIEVSGGVVTEVNNLPPGYDYEILDHDI